MPQLILRTTAVTSAIDQLLSQRVHPVFAGYLCLKRESARVRQTSRLQPNFWEFHDTFLRVPGGPEGKPYYRPFWNEALVRQKAWYQKNVAGTYAPGSASRIPAFTQVVSIERQRYSLRERHWELARQYLLGGRPLPVLPLATFLYRDFGFDLSEPVRVSDLVSIFRREFGYTEQSGDDEFDHLYSTGGMDSDPARHFEGLSPTQRIR